MYFYTLINRCELVATIKKDGTNLTEIDIFNEDVFKYPENTSILYKFYVDPDRGYSLYLPRIGSYMTLAVPMKEVGIFNRYMKVY